MEAKDSRIKIINEIIAGVKVEFITSILSLENYPCREKVGPNSFYFPCIGGSRQSSQGLLSFFFFFYSFCVTLFALANQLLPYRILSHRLDEWRRLGQWIPFTGFSWLPAVPWLNLCPTPSTFIYSGCNVNSNLSFCLHWKVACLKLYPWGKGKWNAIIPAG